MSDIHKDRSFSATEVGTMLKSLRNDIGVVGEGVQSLAVRMDRVENRLGKVETRLTAVEDTVRLAIPSISKRLSTLETKAG